MQNIDYKMKKNFIDWKKLVPIFGAGVLFTGCATTPRIVLEPKNQEEVFRNLGIPERFLNYEKNDFTKKVVEFGGRSYGVIDYLKDGKVEVREGYKVISEDEEGYSVEAKPFRYLFEMNKLGGFQDDEVLTDDHEDGLNGNERWYEIRVVKLEKDII
jgi:hypothetical protein